jgi:hypothetical protein
MTFAHLRTLVSLCISGASLSPSDLLHWDDCCRGLNGPASYCKTWQNPSVCEYGDQPCGLSVNITGIGCLPNASNQTYLPACDTYCDKLGVPGANSTICAYWEPNPVCGGTNVSCEASTCSIGVTLANRCDHFCELVSGPTSQCSSLTASATCAASGISCDSSLCTDPISLCDNYCFRLNGPSSFCASDSTCFNGDQPCTFRQCGGPKLAMY